MEYIDGIEVIKAFGKTESSYAKFTKAAFEYADSFISWMKRCSIDVYKRQTFASVPLKFYPK